MDIKSFNRNEIKFLLNPAQFEIIKAEIEERMTPDGFCRDGGSYMVYNIYFDTEKDDIIRRSLSKPYYKEKLRLRSYTMPARGDDKVFPEIKKKVGGVVAKRRASMSYNEAMEFFKNRKQPCVDGYQDIQIMKEIAEFLSRYDAKPKLYLSYERSAFFDKDDSQLRVSFDKDILTRRHKVNLIDGDFGSELLKDGGVLMEVKCGGSIPVWLCGMLSELGVHKTSFSKYGEEYKNYLQTRTSKQTKNLRISVPEMIYPKISVSA